MILKDILNQVLSQSAHITKSNFTSSNDVDDQQMVAIANRVVNEIVGFYPWGELRKIFEITIQPNQLRYATPQDFKGLVSDSIRQSGSNRRVEINVPDGRWYEYKFGTTGGGGMYRARLYGNEIEFAEANVGDKISMEYESTWVVKDDTGSLKPLFTSDTDSYELDDSLLILGIQAHWSETKMLPQAGKWMANYRTKTNEAIGRDVGAETFGGRPNRSRGNAPYTPLYK